MSDENVFTISHTIKENARLLNKKFVTLFFFLKILCSNFLDTLKRIKATNKIAYELAVIVKKIIKKISI